MTSSPTDRGNDIDEFLELADFADVRHGRLGMETLIREAPGDSNMASPNLGSIDLQLSGPEATATQAQCPPAEGLLNVHANLSRLQVQLNDQPSSVLSISNDHPADDHTEALQQLFQDSPSLPFVQLKLQQGRPLGQTTQQGQDGEETPRLSMMTLEGGENMGRGVVGGGDSSSGAGDIHPQSYHAVREPRESAGIGLGWPSQRFTRSQDTVWSNSGANVDGGEETSMGDGDATPPHWLSLLGRTAQTRSATYEVGMSSSAPAGMPSSSYHSPAFQTTAWETRPLRHAVSTSDVMFSPSSPIFLNGAKSSTPEQEGPWAAPSDVLPQTIPPQGLVEENSTGLSHVMRQHGGAQVPFHPYPSGATPRIGQTASGVRALRGENGTAETGEGDSEEPFERSSTRSAPLTLPIRLPDPPLWVLSSPYQDLRRHLIRHGMRGEADVYAPLPPDYALHGYMTAIPGGPPALVEQSARLLLDHEAEVARQMARSKLDERSADLQSPNRVAERLPEALHFDLEGIDHRTIAENIIPTHILAAHSSISRKDRPPMGMLLPIHSLPYILQCVSLPALPPTDMSQAMATGTLEMPVVSVIMPRPDMFPLTHRFVYNRDTVGLLAELLPVRLVERLIQEDCKDTSDAKTGDLGTSIRHSAPSDDAGDPGPRLLRHCVELLATGTTKAELLQRLSQVHACWANGLAIGFAPSIYWETLSKAWSFLISALQLRQSQGGR